MNFSQSMKKATGAFVLAGMFALPFAAYAQTYSHETTAQRHARAVRSQHRHDARHHTTAKVVGGSAAGGAVVGGLLGGGKGAVIGAGVGAGGGLVADHVRKDNGVKKREDEGR